MTDDNDETTDAPRCYGADIDAGVRMEMLVGRFADILAPARALIEQMQPRANASTTTRSTLDLIWQTQMKTNNLLVALIDELIALRTGEPIKEAR